MKGIAWPIVLLLCSILALHNAMRIGPSPLVDELRQRYSADYASIGNVVGAYTFTYAFAQLAAGVLTDRYGSRRLILMGLGLAAFGSTVFALATSYWIGLAGRMLMGLSGGFLYTPTVAYIFSAFAREQRGKAMGFAESGVGAGQILGVTIPPLLLTGIGLTGAFLAHPLVAIGLFLAVWFTLPPIAQDRKRGGGQMAALLRQRDFWVMLCGSAFIGMLSQSAVNAWAPTYFRVEYGYSVVEAGLTAGVIVAGLMIFSPIFGLISDRLTARKPVLLAGCVLCLCGLLLLLATRNPWLATIAALAVSASAAATIPVQVVFVSERFAAVGAGTAIGLINTGGQLASSLGGPFYGSILDYQLGFGVVWGAAAVLAVGRILAVLSVRETLPSDRGAHGH